MPLYAQCDTGHPDRLRFSLYCLTWKFVPAGFDAKNRLYSNDLIEDVMTIVTLAVSQAYIQTSTARIRIIIEWVERNSLGFDRSSIIHNELSWHNFS